MKKLGRRKENKRPKRFWKGLRTQLRWGARRVRRNFRQEQFGRRLWGSYARRLYVMLILLGLIGGLCFVSASLSASYLTDEAVLVRRLSDPDFDEKQPVLAALNCFGSTNRLQVTLRTEDYQNLHSEERVDLDRGNINLVLTLQDGKYLEYTLQNRNIDNFESGNTDQFTLILPSSVSPFDITDYKLTLLPDAEGEYGRWHCRWAQVSFLLGGKRTLLAKDQWEEPFIFSKENESYSLMKAEGNVYLEQVRGLYPYVLNICKNEKTTVHEMAMKRAALKELGLSAGDTLYLDIETLSIENQNGILSALLKDQKIPEHEMLGYNGKMALRLYFYTDAGGSYYKDYDLDTLGKDDFELGSSSTFEMTMPEGLCIFDIYQAELLVENPRDYWAPRMMRLYMKTDYGTILELSRFTDTTLTAARGSGVFGKGLIETDLNPLIFDLTAQYAQPEGLKEEIEGRFGMRLSDVAYSMYFSRFDFYQRQKLFYNQLNNLYGATMNEEA